MIMITTTIPIAAYSRVEEDEVVVLAVVTMGVDEEDEVLGGATELEDEVDGGMEVEEVFEEEDEVELVGGIEVVAVVEVEVATEPIASSDRPQKISPVIACV